MLFENLIVDRLIIHEVYKRLDDRQSAQPHYGQELLRLDEAAMGFFRERVVAALGSQSQCLEMAINPPVPGCALEVARDLLNATDSTFVEISRRFADKLTSAQTSRNWPGGIVVIFCGRVGNPACSLVGVIKAETHSSFRPTQTLQVEFLQRLFLGPQTKLYKIGAFLYRGEAPQSPLPDGWQALVHDSQMTSTRRDAAAQYFYESFLGCSLPVNGAQLTKNFFEGTREFIRKIDVDDERKSDLATSLYAYLKVDQSPTIEIAHFSERYLTSDLRDDYAKFMAGQKFPTTAVPKDIADIQFYLKRRKLTFSRNIQLTAPADAYADLVTVKSIPPDPESGSSSASWTQITVRDRIRDQV